MLESRENRYFQNRYSRSFNAYNNLNQKVIQRFILKKHNRSTLSESQSTDALKRHIRTGSNLLFHRIMSPKQEMQQTFTGSAFKNNINHYASQPYIPTIQNESGRS